MLGNFITDRAIRPLIVTVVTNKSFAWVLHKKVYKNDFLHFSCQLEGLLLNKIIKIQCTCAGSPFMISLYKLHLSTGNQETFALFWLGILYGSMHINPHSVPK